MAICCDDRLDDAISIGVAILIDNTVAVTICMAVERCRTVSVSVPVAVGYFGRVCVVAANWDVAFVVSFLWCGCSAIGAAE